MKKCKITVVKTAFMDDLAKEYAHPALGECEMHKVGQEFFTNGWEKPEGMCDNAWKSMMEYAMTLSHGGRNFYKGNWIKDASTAVLCCNDGIRPVFFKLEATNEDAETFTTI